MGRHPALARSAGSVIQRGVDAHPLPVISAAPRALGAEILGLSLRGDARAQGLFDRYGRSHTYLRISVIEKCNLRCRYCMPEEGVPLLPKDDLLTFEEIERLGALFVRLGVRKIRVTGGEPLVRRGIEDLVARLGRLKALGLQRLAMTSNALLLRQHLASFRASGLDAVNLSLDTLRPDRFREITLRDGCEETIEAIRSAAAAGFDAVKVNAVVMAGVNDDEIADLALAFALRDPSRLDTSNICRSEGTTGASSSACSPPKRSAGASRRGSSSSRSVSRRRRASTGRARRPANRCVAGSGSSPA